MAKIVSMDKVTDRQAVELVALVERATVSARLRKAVKGTTMTGQLPWKTVGEYLAAGPDAPRLFSRITEGIGRTTASELDVLVAEFAAGALEWRVAAVTDPEPAARQPPGDPDPTACMAARLGELNYWDVTCGRITASRILETLRIGLGRRPVRGLFVDPARERAALLREPNIGATALRLLEECCFEAAVRRLRAVSHEHDDLVQDCATLFARIDAWPALAARVRRIIADRPPEPANLQAVLEWALPCLTERSHAIVADRYGLGQAEPLTLTATGERHQMTGEGIRHQQNKALQRLRLRLCDVPLADLVRTELARLPLAVEPLESGTGLATSPRLRAWLDPSLNLAIDVLRWAVQEADRSALAEPASPADGH